MADVEFENSVDEQQESSTRDASADHLKSDGFVPSPEQATAIRSFIEWFKHGTHEQPVFKVFGFAGTGKTTCLKYAITELGLSSDGAMPEVLYAAFTGKAALVMTRAGTPAQTIHSLIYRVSEASEAEIDRLKKEIEELEATIKAMGDGPEKNFEIARHGKMTLRLKGAYKPGFLLNEDSILRNASLLVVDEVSMVDKDMAEDLLSFGVPILVLGDPGQLPPIKGEGFFVVGQPDVMLTQVHRQAEGSPIIRLATMAREGRTIPYGNYGGGVAKGHFVNVTSDHLFRADQVICGKNATRLMLNNSMRRHAGYDGFIPAGPQEKVIMLRNRNDLGVVNGQFLTFDNIESFDDKIYFMADVTTEDGHKIEGRQRIYTGHFEDHIKLDKNREANDYKTLKRLKPMHTTFGYSITGHKSQGSQYEKVIVVDDGFGYTEEVRRQWLYTVFTRARSGLWIVD